MKAKKEVDALFKVQPGLRCTVIRKRSPGAASSAKKRKPMAKAKKPSGPKPTNPALYSRVKAAAKRKFAVYPSAYANAWHGA